DFHGGGCSPLLSGTRSPDSGFRCHGPTSDQLVAQMMMGQTRFPSLVYRAQPSWYLSGSSYAGREFISYRGDRDPIDALVSPEVAFQTLFNGFQPMGAAEAARFDFSQRTKLSVLDLVLEKRDALLNKVGSADRQRLTRHFDELRALEMRVRSAPPM